MFHKESQVVHNTLLSAVAHARDRRIVLIVMTLFVAGLSLKMSSQGREILADYSHYFSSQAGKEQK